MRRALLVVALVLALPVAASAQTVDKTVELLPGGKTFGGPGAFQGAPGELQFLFNTNVLNMNICATLANAGAVDVTVTLFILGGATINITVEPGRTGVICGGNITIVSGSCAVVGGTTCKYMWRLDLL
jgi:hypothetical protein